MRSLPSFWSWIRLPHDLSVLFVKWTGDLGVESIFRTGRDLYRYSCYPVRSITNQSQTKVMPSSLNIKKSASLILDVTVLTVGRGTNPGEKILMRHQLRLFSF
jgi:hypothetical protein